MIQDALKMALSQKENTVNPIWSSVGLKIAGIIFFIIIIFFIYSNTLDVPFVYDDIDNILNNNNIRIKEFSWFSITGLFNGPTANRPFSGFSFALNYYFHQYDLFGYHLVNITIHLMTGLSLFILFQKTLKILPENSHFIKKRKQYSFLIPFFSAWIWLVHPLHVQSVTYVVQRMNSMSSFFYILSLLLYVQGRIFQRSWRKKNLTDFKAKILLSIYFTGSAISGVLAITSKEMATTLPLFILLYEWFFFKHLRVTNFRKIIFGVSIAILVFGVISWFFLGRDPISVIHSAYRHASFSLPQRLFTEARVVVYYISLLFFPHPKRLVLDYDYPVSTALISPQTTAITFLMLAFITGAALFKARRNPIFSFCVLWLLGNLVIESSIIPIEIIYEHRTYLPSVMISFFMVCLLFRCFQFKISVLIALTVVVLFSSWTYQRNEVWTTEIFLWKDCALKSPNNARSNFNLGLAYHSAGDPVSALPFLKKAVLIKHDYVKSLSLIGDIFSSKGDFPEAEKYFKDVLMYASDSALANFNFGNVLMNLNRIDEAKKYYSYAVKLSPNEFYGYSGMGILLYHQLDYEDAIPYLIKAQELLPKDQYVCLILGNAYSKTQNYIVAQQYFEKALGIEPKNVSVYLNLGAVLDIQQKFDQAIRYFKEAIDLFPTNAAVYYNMGIVLSHAGDYKTAQLFFEKVLELAPEGDEIRNKIIELKAHQ